MIQISQKEDCCGCEACSNACPVQCISMCADEKGFLYPKVDPDRCVECHLCEKVCPVAGPLRDTHETVLYAVQNKEESVRMDSTSGGMFSLIAEWVVQRQGIVLGAAFDEAYHVVHRSAENKEELSAFRGSKYVQSRISHAYQEVRKNLQDGKWVCFSGTPCQVNGLKKYLGREYDRLITVDFACHGITSPVFWDKYLRYHRERRGQEITSVQFREKYYGYGFSTMKIGFGDGSCYRAGMESDIYLRSFFMDLNTRESCHDCRFKTVERVSDFTLFDGWHAERFDSSMKDDRGTTFCIIQSRKGQELFEDIRKKTRWARVPSDPCIQLDGKMLLHSTSPHPLREEFFRDILSMSVPEIQDKYYPMTLKRRMLSKVKPLIYKIGLFRLYMLYKEKAGKGIR